MAKHYGADTYNMVDNDGNEYQLVVEYDECAEDPREWTNVAKIWCWHRHYKIGDKPYGDCTDSLEHLCAKYTNMSEDEIYEANDNEKFVRLQASDNIVIVPINCYEHSGITISTSSGYPYNDRWDAGMIGFAFVDKETVFNELGGIPLKDENGKYIREEYKHEGGPSTYGVKCIPLTDDNWKKRARMCIDGEVETLDCYVRGDVYGYTLNEKVHVHDEKKCPCCEAVIDTKDYDEWEEEDSCWGFYGDNIEDNGILDELPSGLRFKE